MKLYYLSKNYEGSGILQIHGHVSSGLSLGQCFCRVWQIAFKPPPPPPPTTKPYFLISNAVLLILRPSCVKTLVRKHKITACAF